MNNSDTGCKLMPGEAGGKSLEQAEREHIVAILKECNGRIQKYFCHRPVQTKYFSIHRRVIKS